MIWKTSWHNIINIVVILTDAPTRKLFKYLINYLYPHIFNFRLKLQLVEGINNDVAISSIVNGGHVFLQQPLHPSFPSLNTMQQCMNQSYNMVETPQLPEITENAICVAAVRDNWYRVQVVSHNAENKSCLVKYLDYGGYASVSIINLRQIRTDFMGVPFQSIECVLSNVKPIGKFRVYTKYVVE